MGKKKRKDLFDAILDEIDEIVEDLLDSIDFENDKPFMYGFSITHVPGEEPEIRRFGKVPSDEDHTEITPMVDVFEEDEEIRVIADLPGVEREDIFLDATEDEFRIFASTEFRKYSKVVEL
ncbi:MAG: Hsp20/alpha crystallin family protein, partial [Candidatus Syntropharchaeia archaeon]